MISNRQAAALKAFGGIESIKNDLSILETALGDLPLWLPAAALKKQCAEALRMIDGISQRLERKLVVTIVGPCGAGKSTLLNALAGTDDLSATGHQRPTTDHIIVFSADDQDARQLVEALGRQSVEVASSPAAAALEHVLLIDTPDTDSTAYQAHAPLVRETIARSDMLICVFDSENPKRRDHVDFLSPFIGRFNGQSLVAVINKCDRQDEAELKNRILPDFAEYIRTAWPTPVDRLLCLSARRHLQNSRWDETAAPKHDFDQFEELRQLIFEDINRAGYVVDRRLENAASLRDFVFQEMRRQISVHRPHLETAAQQIREAEKKSFLAAVAAMKNDDSQHFFGVDLMVYQQLTQRWVGPMGWMIAIWARLMIFGSGVAALFRFGRPVRQVMGMVSAWRNLKQSKSSVDEAAEGQRVDAGLRTYQLSTMGNWPDIAELLVAGGFDAAVRQVSDVLPAENTFSEKLAGIWTDVLQSEIERLSGRLSGGGLQILFNLPVVGVLGYIGWITVRRFFLASYLTGGFFLHALWVIAIVLLLSFFIFQLCVRLTAGAERVTARAFEKMKHRADQLATVTATPVQVQLETIAGLETFVSTRTD